MLSTVINPISLLISLTAVFGVFIHDTQIDHATLIAVSNPAAANNSGVTNLSPVNQHLHIESSSFANSLKYQQPATRPRNEDERKYVAQKRLLGNALGNEYSWPSI